MADAEISVTVDTNTLATTELATLVTAAADLPIHLAHTSVSDREMEEFEGKPPQAEIPETAVWGESRWGEAVWGSDESGKRLEAILKTISAGSFPPPGGRARLSDGQRRQLRDAMIFEAHVREGRDIFVSDDRSAFLGSDGSRRRRLEEVFGTKVMTSEEFRQYCERRHSAGAS